MERLKEVKNKQTKGLACPRPGVAGSGDPALDEQDSPLIAQESEIPECERDLVMTLHADAVRGGDIPCGGMALPPHR